MVLVLGLPQARKGEKSSSDLFLVLRKMDLRESVGFGSFMVGGVYDPVLRW